MLSNRRTPFVIARNAHIAYFEDLKRSHTSKEMAPARKRYIEVINIKIRCFFFQASLKCAKDKSAINAQQLSQFPELVPQLCLNEPEISYCTTMAQVS